MKYNKYKIQLNPFYSSRQERVSAEAKGEAGVTLLQFNKIHRNPIRYNEIQ